MPHFKNCQFASFSKLTHFCSIRRKLRKPSEPKPYQSSSSSQGIGTMSMSRDRLIREEDPAEVYLRNRGAIYTGVNRFDSFTPFRWGSTPLTGTDRVMGLASVGNNSFGGVSGSGIIVRPRIGRRGGFDRSVIGRENISPVFGRARGRGRGRSVLPSWYPRRPLQDITPIVRVLEARRAIEREDEGLQRESPVAQDQSVHDHVASTSGAQLEHDLSMKTPAATVGKRRPPLTARKLPKLLHDITKDNTGDQAFLTPQRKLLNSIEAVEKVVREELEEWKNSPAGKKFERQLKVRTLMSMR